MGIEASKSLDPPENWDEKNKHNLTIISPTAPAIANHQVPSISKQFEIVSPISDISNPSDIFNTMHSSNNHNTNNNNEANHYHHHHHSEKLLWEGNARIQGEGMKKKQRILIEI